MFLRVTEARYLEVYRIEVAFNNSKNSIKILNPADFLETIR